MYVRVTLSDGSNGNVLCWDDRVAVGDDNDGLIGRTSCSFDWRGNERNDESLRIESLTVSYTVRISELISKDSLGLDAWEVGSTECSMVCVNTGLISIAWTDSVLNRLYLKRTNFVYF